MMKIFGLLCALLGTLSCADAAQKSSREAAQRSFRRERSGVLKPFPSAADLRSGSDDSLSATKQYDATLLEKAFKANKVQDFITVLHAGGLTAKHYCQTNFGSGLLWERVIERVMTDPAALAFINVLMQYDIDGVNESSTTFPLGTPLGMILHADRVNIDALTKLLEHKKINSSLRMTEGSFVEEASTNEEAQALVQQHRDVALQQAVADGQQCVLCKRAVDDTAMMLSCCYDHHFHKTCLEAHVHKAGIPRGWPNCPTCNQSITTGDVAAICPVEERDKIAMYESEGEEGDPE